MHRSPISIVDVRVPADSGDIYVADTTAGCVYAPVAAPGPFRGRWQGGRVRGTVKNGDQVTTLTFQTLTGNAGTSSDFETDTTATSAGVIAIAANATQVVDWMIPGADGRIKLTAGSNNTSSLICRLTITFDQSAAV